MGLNAGYGGHEHCNHLCISIYHHFNVCCVQRNMLLCQHVYVCILSWSICHAFVVCDAIVSLCAVCKAPCCCISMYVPSVPSESHEFTLSQVAYMRVMNKCLSGLINTVSNLYDCTDV